VYIAMLPAELHSPWAAGCMYALALGSLHELYACISCFMCRSFMCCLSGILKYDDDNRISFVKTVDSKLQSKFVLEHVQISIFSIFLFSVFFSKTPFSNFQSANAANSKPYR